MWWVLFWVCVFFYLIGSFMEGYNKFDQPSKTRQIARDQKRLVELKEEEVKNQNMEIEKLKLEIEKLKLEQQQEKRS